MNQRLNLEQEEPMRWMQLFGEPVQLILPASMGQAMSEQGRFSEFLFPEPMHMHLFKRIVMNMLHFVNMQVLIKTAFFGGYI